MLPEEYVVVLTTWPAEGDFEAFASTLVTEQLAACINVLPPMTSIYRWEGRVDRAAERQVVIKTARARVDALRERLQTLHPYEVPEFLVLTVAGGSDEYLRWIADATGGAEDLRT